MRNSFRREKPTNGSSLKVSWPGREALSFQESPKSYSQLVSALLTAYQLNPELLKLTYTDEDGDAASVFDDDSYLHALKQAKTPRLILILDTYPEHWLKEGTSKRPVPVHMRRIMEFYRRNQARMSPPLASLYRKIIKNKAACVTEAVLDNQSAGIEEAQKLAVALPCFHNLQSISIRNGALGSEGTQSLMKSLGLLMDYKLVLSEGITPITHFSSLNLSGNDLGLAGIKELVQGFSAMQDILTLKLDGNALKPEGGKVLGAHLPLLHRLENLGLDDNGLANAGTAAVAEGIQSLVFLKVVWLEGNKMSIDGATALARGLPHNLQFLWLARNDLNILSQRTLAQAAGLSCTIFFS